MIRTTAEASSTSFPVPPPAISARTVLADQLLRAWIEDRGARRKGKGLKIGKSLPATLAAIAATSLLQITKRLLAQAAPVLAGPELQHLVQRIRKIADLKGCHQKTCALNDQLHAVYLHFACSKRLQIRQAAGQVGDQFDPHTPTGSWAFNGSASSRAIPVGSLMSRHSKVGPMNSSV